ncbi:hypothetical protein ElyMa_000879000 [Elysia marginata]|uniref:Uncharacterized protein n=1 Tax=Elysia marginata TaxID=1093978 RepID=A0AAV4H5F7_9GAST|nr:hypothetical protein ElyMa_000879000 [Elysia marginata]
MSQRFSDVCDSLILNAPASSNSDSARQPPQQQQRQYHHHQQHLHTIGEQQQQQQDPRAYLRQRSQPQPSPPRAIPRGRHHRGDGGYGGVGGGIGGGGGGFWAGGNQGLSYSHLGLPGGGLAGSAPASLCRPDSAPFR